MVKRAVIILLIISVLLGIGAPASAQQAQPVLTTFDFTIVGVGIGVSPAYQAVPNGISSQVNTDFFAPGIAFPDSILNQLPKDY